MANLLDPASVAQFSNMRRSAALQYGSGLATNQYQRSALDQNNTFNTQQLTRQFDQTRNRLPGNYARRGLLTSGIYAQGLQDYGQNRLDAFQKQLMGYQQAAGGYDQNQRNLESGYAGSIADIAAQEQQRQAEIAAQLRMLG